MLVLLVPVVCSVSEVGEVGDRTGERASAPLGWTAPEDKISIYDSILILTGSKIPNKWYLERAR